ncbi:MAG: outer membrane beta-barrel protein [Aquificae bacterium]|nr:outer membrane beta-barrel protein [Aquificota bacterium]
MKKIFGLAAAGLFITSVANAGSLTVANSDIELSGGVSAGYFYTSNLCDEPCENPKNDYFTVSSFAIGLTSKVNSTIGFTASFGASPQSDLLGLETTKDFGPEFAYVSIRPIEGLTLDAGLLTTNIGYELYHTWENPNYTFGMVWWGQPVTYPGARATFNVAENLDVYAEYSQDGVDSFAVGAIGSYEGVDFAFSYFDYSAQKNLIDVVLSTSVAGIDVALNADYQWLDDSAKVDGQDDSAFGVGLYIIPKLSENVSLPVRIEYIDEGTSDIYGVAGDNAWAFTITPTWAPASNAYLRAEFAYVATDEKGFYEGATEADAEDTRTFIGVEAGFRF